MNNVNEFNTVIMFTTLAQLSTMIIVIVSLWKIFSKAGLPGWGILIPIYNVYLFIRLAGRPGWWMLLLLVPFLNLVILFVLCFEIAENFGLNGLFGIGMFFLSVIFLPILAFSGVRYKGPKKSLRSSQIRTY